jgi:hypothetical protein
MFATAVALWRVIVIAVPLSALGMIAAYEFGVHDGRMLERIDAANASTVSAQAWSQWLSERAKKDDELLTEIRQSMVAKVEIRQQVDNATEKAPDTECLTDEFLRALAKLR